MSHYFFEGEFKRKKDISLRDTKHNQILTKATLIGKVQEERIARLQKKQQATATDTLVVSHFGLGEILLIVDVQGLLFSLSMTSDIWRDGEPEHNADVHSRICISSPI